VKRNTTNNDMAATAKGSWIFKNLQARDMPETETGGKFGLNKQVKTRKCHGVLIKCPPEIFSVMYSPFPHIETGPLCIYTHWERH
jgi:hypothetical protein